MDIILRFERKGVGSIPASPAKNILLFSQNIVDNQLHRLYNRHIRW